MKQEEKHVEQFLKEHGFKTIDFEPLGESKAPDFRIDGNIAVEVRRLNKHVAVNNTLQPIEDLEYKFVPKFRKLLDSMDDPDLDYSIAVTLKYKRPIKLSKDLLKGIKNSILKSTKLEVFGVEIEYNNQIKYELYKGNGKTEKTYNLIIWNDYDKGGIVQDARYEAARICINEKTEKLIDLKEKFSALWLILVDDIFSHVDYATKQDFERFPQIESIFDRIIIVSKINSKNWIELYE